MPTNPLLRDGYVYRMVLQHEYQHNETILQTLQLKQGEPYTPPRSGTARPGRGARRMTRCHGSFPRGTRSTSVPTTGLRPTTTSAAVTSVTLAPFWIDVTPVTNGEYLSFIAAGGYQDRAYWSDDGWEWVNESAARAPKYWSRGGDGWISRSMDRTRPGDPGHPVIHVCYYEAEAFAKFAGKRLPTEQEWEAAASWDPETGTKRSYPWGEEPPTKELANVDQLSFGTASVGAYPPMSLPSAAGG